MTSLGVNNIFVYQIIMHETISSTTKPKPTPTKPQYTLFVDCVAIERRLRLLNITCTLLFEN
jgi:hypothetical protein